MKDAAKKAVEESGKLEEADFEYTGKSIRERGYLLPPDFLYIVCWKAPGGRRGKAAENALYSIREKGAKEIENVTREAFKLAEEGDVEKAIEKLDDLYGIDVRTASAILTFYNPQKFGVIDKNAWKTLYDEDKNSFEVQDYMKYLRDIRGLAKKCNMTARGVDVALWYIGGKLLYGRSSG
ncbi:MAG: hypothetical protein JTT14_02940 [Candidatus Brockarchaeota archaeon]|nr:hypothetical protein [Candidatus Brockarchaeota archaeon]